MRTRVTSSVSMMLQQCPMEVTIWPGFFDMVAGDDGSDQDSQNPRQALVVM